MQLWSGQVPLATMISKKAVFGTERSGAENSLSISNCVDECWVGPGDPPANSLIGGGKAENLSAQQGAYLYDNQQVIARAKEAIRKEERHKLVEIWQSRWQGEQTGRWTHRLILQVATWLNRNHGEVGFYLVQELQGYGCFNSYLKHFKKNCGSPLDDAEHTLFVCARRGVAREVVGRKVGAELSPDTMVPLMLQSKVLWRNYYALLAGAAPRFRWTGARARGRASGERMTKESFKT